jgi:hypothetical protein
MNIKLNIKSFLLGLFYWVYFIFNDIKISYKKIEIFFQSIMSSIIFQTLKL